MTTDLITRIEQAGEDEQGVLLEEAYDLCPSAWRGGNNRRRFRDMLDLGAYLSAAEMLVPEGWTLEHLGQWRTNVEYHWKWWAKLGSPERSHNGWPKRVAECFGAHTIALALAAACLKAYGESERD